MTPLTVVLVDDDPDVRAVIRALLTVRGSFEVVAEASDGNDAVATVNREQPDVVLLDLSMPVMDGLTALPLVREAAPRARVVVLSGFGTDHAVHLAMRQGADAFVHKDGELASKLSAALADLPPRE